MKSRFWSFILYPESCCPDFEDVLIDMGCCFAVSPLHDKDYNPTGELKKPHYHILVQFDGPTTYKNVKENICDVIGATIPKKVLSLRAYYRYFCHLDNPEKAQYSVTDVKCYGGFHCDLTTSEITSLKAYILKDIEQHCILEYRDLCTFYLEQGDFDRFDIVSNHTYFFNQYLTSYRCTLINKKK